MRLKDSQEYNGIEDQIQRMNSQDKLSWMPDMRTVYLLSGDDRMKKAYEGIGDNMDEDIIELHEALVRDRKKLRGLKNQSKGVIEKLKELTK